jgi:hypothetical protein
MLLSKNQIEKIIDGNLTQEEINELRRIPIELGKFEFEICDISKFKGMETFENFIKFQQERKTRKITKRIREKSELLRSQEYFLTDTSTPEEIAKRERLVDELEDLKRKQDERITSFLKRFGEGGLMLNTQTFKSNMSFLLSARLTKY